MGLRELLGDTRKAEVQVNESNAQVARELRDLANRLDPRPTTPVPEPKPPVPRVSKDKPIFGVDVSHWQQGLSLSQVAKEGYKFAIIKATEGPYRDGRSYVDPNYGRNMNDARAAGLLVGAYHFLVNTPAKPQVDLFLKTVGETKDKLLVVDFEAYPNFPPLSPTNEILKAFVAELKRRTNNHPVLIYSGQGFWTGGDPSGAFAQYGATQAWDAYYPKGFDVNAPRLLYEEIKHKGWGQRWGGVEPILWQFTSTGKVAGFAMDVNASRVSMDALRQLTNGSTSPKPPKPEPKPEKRPLVPPGFVPKDPIPNSSRYDLRCPTRYNIRPDIERIIRMVWAKHPEVTWVTYFHHPESVWLEHGIQQAAGFCRLLGTGGQRGSHRAKNGTGYL